MLFNFTYIPNTCYISATGLGSLNKTQYLSFGSQFSYQMLILSRLLNLCPRKCGQLSIHVETLPSYLYAFIHSISSPWNAFPFLQLKACINFLSTNSNSTSYLGPILVSNLIWGSSSFESQHFLCNFLMLLSFFFFARSPFYLFILTTLLEYNCFTMLCQFLLYNKVNHMYTYISYIYVYIYPHIPSLLCLPPSLLIHVTFLMYFLLQ